MTDPWRILVVDDEESLAEMTAELLSTQSGVSVSAIFEKSFEESLPIISEGKFDILVLDVRNQSLSKEITLVDENVDPGLSIFETIRSRKFLPIVFYTALPELVQPLSNPPFVQIVSKIDNDDTAELRDAIAKVIDSELLNITRALDRHIETVTHGFMGDFVEKNWGAFHGHKADLAHLLLRRLSVSLERGVESFAHELGYSTDLDSSGGVHTARVYVVPPIEDHHRMGDILSGPNALNMDTDQNTLCWYVILTPSCDLVKGRVKADYVVLAECRYLDDFAEYKDWLELDSNTKKERLIKLLNSRPESHQEDRYHYLPKAWDIPDLMVDLQRICHIPYDRLDEYTTVASLDSPFSEALSYRFNRYMGRVGTPDLDLDAALDRMRRDG